MYSQTDASEGRGVEMIQIMCNNLLSTNFFPGKLYQSMLHSDEINKQAPCTWYGFTLE